MKENRSKYLIAILDDEENMVNQLETICINFFSGRNISIEVCTYSDPIEFDFSKTFDLILLDIEMTTTNGIEFAKRLRKTNLELYICFITSHSQYSLDSHKVHAFDYIMKPISRKKIEEFLNEFLIYDQNSSDQTIVCSFDTTHGTVNMPIDRIICFEYYSKSDVFLNRSVKMTLVNGKELIIKSKIGDVMKVLPAEYFYSPHKSFIINLQHVEQLLLKEVKLKGGIIIPISQKKSSDIKRVYGKFIKDYYL